MARINLLPWRDELRKQKQREFITIAAGSAFLMLLVILYVHMHINAMIADQESRNRFLEQQIAQVEAKIDEISKLEAEKQRLVARIKVIEQLQRNRPEIVHLFEELVKAVPEGVFFSSVNQSGNTLFINGEAQSNARVSALMRNLEASPWFVNPDLQVIQAKGNDAQAGRTFEMKVQQETPQSE